MDKQDVKKIVNDEIRSFVKDSLDNEVRKIISKSNSPTRGEMITIIKNALEAVYKVLWMKRDFWKTDIK
jgi:hypothetical protein